MNKMKQWMILAAILTALLLCTACGSSKKMPDDLLKQAIQNQDDNYNTYGLSITDFQIGERNYDSDYKSESVSVSIRAENGDSSYAASYEVTGLYENKNWKVTSVSQTDMTVLPKSPLPDALVEADTEQLLQEEENVQYFLTQVGHYGHSGALEQDIEAEGQLVSNTQYMSTTRDYQLYYHYTLDGWELSGKNEDNVQVHITDELCGTWVGSVGEDSYKFVIDHIEGDTAYVKYQARFEMPHYTWSSRMISRGYDTLTPVPISVVYENWKSDYYGLKIVFEKTRYAQYVAEDTYDTFWSDPMTIAIRVYPDHCPQWLTSNGTVEEGKAYVLTDISGSPVKGKCILTKQ